MNSIDVDLEVLELYKMAIAAERLPAIPRIDDYTIAFDEMRGIGVAGEAVSRRGWFHSAVVDRQIEILQLRREMDDLKDQLAAAHLETLRERDRANQLNTILMNERRGRR